MKKTQREQFVDINSGSVEKFLSGKPRVFFGKDRGKKNFRRSKLRLKFMEKIVPDLKKNKTNGLNFLE